MPGRIHRRLLAWKQDDKNRGVKLAAVLLLVIIGAAFLVADGRRALTPIEGEIPRNAYGEGTRTEELQIEAKGKEKKEKIQVDIGERQYDAAQIKEVFAAASEHMDRWILGENKSLDRIESDLDLITKVPDQPIEIEWEPDRYDVINVMGELQKEALTEKGTKVTLSAVMTYTEDPAEQAMYECTAMLYPKQADRTLKASVEQAVQEEEKATRTAGSLKLPETVDGQGIAYYRGMDSRGPVLLAMAVLIGILLYALDKQKEQEAEKEKQKQMLRDYPDIINKFTLLLGAGMTAKNVWRKMVADYEEQRENWGTRYAYEEMKITWHEMQGGVTEAESYERFGKRCGLQVYVKFGALLSQNLRKGTKGLNQLLKADAIQAFEERKARARRLGEEAGTKLLLPMFLMLAVVLIIVVVPAFFSMQM